MSLVSTAHRLVMERECHLVELAAHWADLHHPASQSVAAVTLPGGEQARMLGGQGTPEVLEFAAAELGAGMETTTGSARAFLADALDLRHRLPELWQLVRAGRVRAWRARKVAQATRHLSVDSAKQVDAAVAYAIVGLPWNRFELLLSAKIIEADPKAAEEQARIWEAERFVRSRSTEQSGLKLLIARANAGDVIWFMATVNRLAEILRLRGDLDSADVRRSKAIGILAQPAVALQLLWDFRNERHLPAEAQRPDEPIDNEPDPALHGSTSPFAESSEPDLFDFDRADAPWAPSSASGQAQPSAGAVPGRSVDSQAHDGGELVIRPTGLDHRKMRPQVVLHIHLSQEVLLAQETSQSGGRCGGVARLEDAGPLTLGQVQRFLAQSACEVTVQPVVDPADTTPADAYEIPRRIRESMFLRMPASCFPYSARVGRRVDLDHTSPYLPPARGGPPAQTAAGNLGPLSRSEHRLKTYGRWRVRQPEAGVFLWRSPTRACYLVTNAGTYALGYGPFARWVWAAARMAG
jgi:Domain of unknown function (DUF222)